MIATDPFTGLSVDLGICVFVDDVATVHVDADGADAARLERKIRQASLELTDRLAEKGYAQNAAKQVSLVQFRGKGNAQGARERLVREKRGSAKDRRGERDGGANATRGKRAGMRGGGAGVHVGF